MCQLVHFDTMTKALCKLWSLWCRVLRALLKGTFIQPGIHPALPAACQSKNQGVLELICQ